MKELLNEIEIALNNKLYLIALQTCLALPDICGAIQSDDGRATKVHYEKWYEEYATKKIDCRMTAEECYLFRCSMLHQGTTIPSPQKNQTSNYSRVVFVLSEKIFMHNNVLFEALNIDLHIFCRGIMEGVVEWQAKMEESQNQNYIINYKKLVKKYLEGISPFTLGILTIT